MTNGFALNRHKTLQSYFCVKRLAINNFLKDVESKETCVPYQSFGHSDFQTCSS